MLILIELGSKSYETLDKLPKSKVKFIESTG